MVTAISDDGTTLLICFTAIERAQIAESKMGAMVTLDFVRKHNSTERLKQVHIMHVKDESEASLFLRGVGAINNETQTTDHRGEG